MKANIMDFFESAMIFVPSLTGMDMTLYGGMPNVLNQFEKRRCFSPELQQIYTQEGLADFLQNASKMFIYNIVEVMGTHLIITPVKENWFLLGPFVEEGWNERTARLLLTALGASEAFMPLYQAYRCKLPIVQQDYALKTALLLAEHSGSTARTVKTIHMDQVCRGKNLTFSDAYESSSEVNQRYLLEDRFIAAIIQGNAGKAHETLNGIWKVSTDMKFISDSFQDRLAGMAVVRTMIRMAAKWGGLSPVLIDAISQEYAQKMHHTVSKAELEFLTTELVERFCSEMRKQRNSKYSPIIRQAAEYIEVNLSKSVTSTEIARAVGLGKKRFVERFRRETGMTVKEYLADRRCAIAAQLLIDSRASVQEIAAYVGYSDNNYFSKVFKATCGFSPQAYRSIHRAPRQLN